jgi:hypothetical protein
MKEVKITPKKSGKLIEICRKLFPEYDWIQINRDNSIVFMKYHDTIQKNGSTETKVTATIIHWFEFSWIILSKLICKLGLSPLEITQTIESYGLICFNRFESQHPIDYLYDIFEIYTRKGYEDSKK